MFHILNQRQNSTTPLWFCFTCMHTQEKVVLVYTTTKTGVKIHIGRCFLCVLHQLQPVSYPPFTLNDNFINISRVMSLSKSPYNISHLHLQNVSWKKTLHCMGLLLIFNKYLTILPLGFSSNTN